jgi:hypothetical protein
MEITILNVLFVTIILLVIYYIGYVVGYTKSTIINNSIIKDKRTYVYNIDGYDIELDRKVQLRTAKLEKTGDLYYIYDTETDVYLGSGSDVFSIKNTIVKYLTDNKLYDILYTVRKEDRELLINESNNGNQSI